MKYLMIILLTAGVLWAQPRSFERDQERTGRGIDRIESILGLNSDQQKKIDELRSEMQKKQIDLKAKVRTIRIEIKDLYSQESPDRKAIESKLNQINKLQNDMQLNRMDFWFGVNNILTQDQQKVWKKWNETIGSRRGMKNEMRGFRGREFGGRGDNFRRAPRNYCAPECPFH